MEAEMRALAVNETWDLVDPPRHYKTIKCKWVYQVKYSVDGLVNWYKFRLEAKGYHDIDYNKTFALVAKKTTIHVVLVVVAARGWHIHQMDIKNMFLQGDLEEQVFMV